MMDSWRKGPLGDLCTLQRGFDLPKANRHSGQYPLVASNGIIDCNNEFAVSGPGVVTGRSGSIGKVFFVRDSYWPLNTTLYVKDFHDNDPLFVYYYLTYFNLAKYSTGTGVPTLNRNVVHSKLISFPRDISVQKKIAQVLLEVDATITATQKVINQIEELKKSLLQKIFVENSYQTIKLAETGSNIQYGYTASATTENTGVKMLRITDVQNGTVNWDNVPFCECSSESFDKYKLQQGDIVFARTGATTGKSYRITENQDSVFASYLIRVQTGDRLDNAYLSYFFQSPLYWKQIMSGIEGGAQGGFNSTKLGQLDIATPELPEQSRIADLLGSIDTKLNLNKQLEFRQEQLKKSLMRELLTGKVQV